METLKKALKKTRKNDVVGSGTGASAGIRRTLGTAMLAALLSACGGSDPEIGNANTSCSVPDQKTWLRGYMLDTYFWSGQSLNPEPGPYATVPDYFEALLFPGEGSSDLNHRWSYISDTAAYNQFFEEGKSLGFGLSVNGIEQQLPLKLRYVEPLSPGSAAGLRRGDTIVSINGVSAADMLASADYRLDATQAGQTIDIVIDRGAGPLSYRLAAATYTLTPVTGVGVLTLPSGAKAGYLSLKDFITAAEAPLNNAFASFAAQGASELILDLRYNGGGRISTSTLLASLVAGVTRNGLDFARLNFNSRHQADNFAFKLGGVTRAGYSRVVVLTGSRTCSASELIVNGLKPYVNVVTLGDTTCGKPVGFSPRDNCGSTYSAVNFETLNANNQGRYYDGIGASCAVAEDFNGIQGNATEKLTAAAMTYLQTGSCPVAVAPGPQSRALGLPRATGRPTTEPGERQGMWAD
jgi:carboxyl-terminal processing protease